MIFELGMRFIEFGSWGLTFVVDYSIKFAGDVDFIRKC